MLRSPMATPELSTARTRLRLPTLEDAEALFVLYGDPEVMRYSGQEPHQSVAQSREKLARDLDAVQRGEAARWVIARKDAPGLIGNVALFHWSQRDRRAELGYMLHPGQWGQGLMKEVLPEVVRFGLEALRLNRVEAQVDPANTASLRLLEGLGFKREGLLRENSLGPDGRYCDTVLLGLLAREAPTGRPL